MSDTVFAEINNLYKKAGYLNLYGIDLIITIVVCLFFLFIIIYYSVINNLEPLKADWDNNKCRPSVIPFAGIINKPDDDTAFEFTQKNFIYCGQTILKTIVDSAFAPIYMAFKVTNELFKNLSNNLLQLLDNISNMQGSSTSIFARIYEILKTMTLPLQQFFINIKDMLNKTLGIFAVTLYTLVGPLFALMGSMDLLAESMGLLIASIIASVIALMIAAAAAAWIPFVGPAIAAALTAIAFPLKYAAAVATAILVIFIILLVEIKRAANSSCFDPNTKIRTRDDELVSMKDLELNTVLKNGSRVVSVMKINNLNERGNVIHKMYEIDNGEENEPIYVTGSHLVYDPMIKGYVRVDNLRGKYPSRVSSHRCPVLYCLITTDHTIPIGDWIFHDWEDNNGSSSKTLK